MKRFLNLFLIPILSFCGIIFRTPNSYASTNDFYFKSGDFDYYLDRTDDGTSIMNVEETLTAVFPEFDQNHGIERCIPRIYNHIDTLVNANFSVLRNGAQEPFSSYNDDEYLCLRIGSASTYVHGTQEYKISYTLENIILAPDNSTNQELYWDINGTSWAQQFNDITASITLSDNVLPAWQQTAYCYVGRYGTSGEEANSRCEISKNTPTITFKTKTDGKTQRFDTQLGQEIPFTGVSSYETMTIDLEFDSETFAIKEPSKNYLLLIILGIFGIIFIISIFSWIKAFNSVKEKRNLAKSKITSPEFTPKHGFTVGEMAHNYLKTLKNPRVASLLELAISHKIELQKGEKKTFGGYKWKIFVKNLDNISEEQRIVLEILNGGSSVSVGEEIEVKSYTSTARLRKLDGSYTTSLERNLEQKGLFVKEKERKKSALGSIFVVFIIYFIGIFLFIGAIIDSVENSSSILIGIDFAFPTLFIGFFAYIFIAILINSSVDKYNKRTIEGIKASRYLDGLKRYMTLAEKDRINFLQSIKGADTSHEGIVKLYEKLLPYAVLFGIEESWMKELNKYYEFDDVSNPDWMMAGAIISASDFRSFTSSTSSTITSSTASASSSSSGGGGGGGGGFSGGGGGGGGGGGW